MTPSEVLARAERAKAAMDEFFGPAFTHVEADYAEKMIKAAASTDPRSREVIEKLALGIKAVRVVRSLIEGHVSEGKLAAADMKHDAKLSRMSDFQRATIGV